MFKALLKNKRLILFLSINDRLTKILQNFRRFTMMEATMFIE